MISPDLNLVVPLYKPDGSIYAYAYSRPISAAAFDMSYRLLIRVFNVMLNEGPIAAKFADKFVRDAAAQLAGTGGDGSSISRPLLNEIGRMSSIILSTRDGWQTIPLQQAIDGKLLEEGDAQEAVNSSIFFSVVWHIAPKANRDGLLQTATELWTAERSSLQPTEWIASLQTSTVTETSGQTAPIPESPAPSGVIRIPGLARAS